MNDYSPQMIEKLASKGLPLSTTAMGHGHDPSESLRESSRRRASEILVCVSFVGGLFLRNAQPAQNHPFRTVLTALANTVCRL